MKTLLVEDDGRKRKRIREFLMENFQKIVLSEAYSYQGGLRCLMEGDYDCLLLDMSLPNYDVTAAESGYKFRHFAGREILEELKLAGKEIPTIVVTAFDKFGVGSAQRTLSQLQGELKDSFTMYRGTVFYSASEEAWKESLSEAIAHISIQ